MHLNTNNMKSILILQGDHGNLLLYSKDRIALHVRD